MDSPKITYRYYSNPAFCGHSEVVYTQQSPCVTPLVVDSPTKHKRHPPTGANSPARVGSLKHRRTPAEADTLEDFSPTKKRIIDTEPEEYSVDGPSEDEGDVPSEIVRSINGRVHRYAIIPSEEDEEFEDVAIPPIKVESPPTFHIRSPGMPRKQIEATQKLHEFLATPKKVIVVGSPIRGVATPDRSRGIACSTPKRSEPQPPPLPPPMPRRTSRSPRMLSYEISPAKLEMTPSKRDFSFRDKEHLFVARSTAVISPRLADRSSNSIYSDGFNRIKWKPTPGCATLLLAAVMLALCGGLTAALSFYLMYMFGRRYYLEIGVISGFTCLILGLLGFRSRTEHMLPNRNYVSGYIVMSVLSLLSCGALLLLLYLGQYWANGALEGAVGGAVTALGCLCLLLSVLGTITSFCCGHPPPDNRVANTRHV